MTIYELIGDYIMDWPIVENAIQRGAAEDRIKQLSKQVFIHLIKVLKWKDDLSYGGHITAINGWLGDIQDVKLKQRKPLTYDNYYDWVCKTHLVTGKSVPNAVIGLTPKYKSLRVLRADSDIAHLIALILSDVCHQLSIGEFVTIEPILIARAGVIPE